MHCCCWSFDHDSCAKYRWPPEWHGCLDEYFKPSKLQRTRTVDDEWHIGPLKLPWCCWWPGPTDSLRRWWLRLPNFHHQSAVLQFLRVVHTCNLLMDAHVHGCHLFFILFLFPSGEFFHFFSLLLLHMVFIHSWLLYARSLLLVWFVFFVHWPHSLWAWPVFNVLIYQFIQSHALLSLLDFSFLLIF